MKAEDLELVPQAQPERRLRPRPEPPPPNLAPRVRRLVDWVAGRIESSWLAALGFVGMCALCVASIVWNLTARFDRYDETYALISQRAELERRFEMLAEHYSTDELHQLLDRVSSAESSVFTDYTGLAQWLSAQAAAARRRDLNMTYVMNDPVPAKIKNVIEIPVLLSIGPVSGSEPGAYRRVLGLLRELVAGRWHLEVVDASVQGDGSGIVGLHTTVHVWVAAGSTAAPPGKRS